VRCGRRTIYITMTVHDYQLKSESSLKSWAVMHCTTISHPFTQSVKNLCSSWSQPMHLDTLRSTIKPHPAQSPSSGPFPCHRTVQVLLFLALLNSLELLHPLQGSRLTHNSVLPLQAWPGVRDLLQDLVLVCPQAYSISIHMLIVVVEISQDEGLWIKSRAVG
jgi:hypothetical protein